MQVRIYASRDEMHAVNVNVPRWAEGFYVNGVSHQYISDDLAFRYDSLIHESIHQLNREYAHIDLPTWLDEGLACYFAVSCDHAGVFAAGRINGDAYPSRHVRELPLSGNLEQDLNHNIVISVDDLIHGLTPLKVDDYFNRYYVHWFTLVHFLMHGEGGRYQEALVAYSQAGAAADAFADHFAAIDEVQEKWYTYVQAMQERLGR